MIVSTWNNGNPNNNTGAGVGIRIPKMYFDEIENWECIRFDNCEDILFRDNSSC